MSNKKFVVFTLVGKGGVSKSTTSVWLHQYLLSVGYNVKGFDTDPVNATYSAFDALDTTHINIYNDKSEIDKSLIDKLIEEHLINLPDNGCAVIDNGATSFNTMLTYLSENKIIELLNSLNIDVYISVPIVGGAEYRETSKGLVTIHQAFDCQKIIWLNSFFGAFPNNEENPHDLIPTFLGDALLAMIDIPDENRDTFGRAITRMQELRLTFEQCENSPEFGLMERIRIKEFNKKLFEVLAEKLPFSLAKAKAKKAGK